MAFRYEDMPIRKRNAFISTNMGGPRKRVEEVSSPSLLAKSTFHVFECKTVVEAMGGSKTKQWVFASIISL